jgi:hypothetical protein
MKPATLACLILAASLGLAAQNNPLPMINNPLVPSMAAPGSAGFTLTVNGTGFVAASKVNWNGSPRATTFVSSNQLTAVISTTDLATATTARVTVTSPSPGGGTSNVAGFAVTAPVSGQVYLATPFNTYAVYPSTTGDFNNDGHLDVLQSLNGNLYAYLGNGDGTFQSALGSPSETGVAGLATGDFNRDGKLDVAIANTNGTVSVLLGNGNGTFQTHIDFPTGTTSSGVAVGDLNGDGNPDLVVANNSPAGGVSVLLGLGNGLFQPQVAYAAGTTPYAVTLGDFNGDGKLDVAVAANGVFSVLMGNGDGTLQRAAIYSLASQGDGQNYSIVAADLNGDGMLDLAVGGYYAIYVMLGKTGGSFGQPRKLNSVSNIDSLVAGDFNEDGILDLASAYFANSFDLLLGHGDGTFHPYQQISLAVYDAFLSVGDFNGDGYLDVSTGAAVLMQTTAKVSVTSLSFPSTYVGQVSAPKTVTLYNYSSLALDISSISISAGSANFSQTNTCGTSLAANTTCIISVVFNPTVVGFQTGTLSIADGAFGNPQTVALSGTGLQPLVPEVTLSPTSLTFGPQKVGTTSSPQNITVTNSGKQTLTITSIAASGDFAQVNTCGTTLKVNQTCTIIVTFTPTATGTRTGDITLIDNAPDSPQTAPLTGTGT